MKIQVKNSSQTMFGKMNGDAFLGNVTKRTSALATNQSFEPHEVSKIWQPSVGHEFLTSSPTEGLVRLSNSAVNQGQGFVEEYFADTFNIDLLSDFELNSELSSSSPESSIIDVESLCGTSSPDGSLCGDTVDVTPATKLVPTRILMIRSKDGKIGVPLKETCALKQSSPKVASAVVGQTGVTKQATNLTGNRTSRQTSKQTLTDKERQLLAQEGIECPTENDLRRIRRKIVNRLSAQESRKRKREEMEQLHNKVKSLTAENEELKQRIQTMQAELNVFKDQVDCFKNMAPYQGHVVEQYVASVSFA